MAMDINYGIGVKNRYALFMGDEESDPLDIISKCKEEVTSGSAAVDKGALTTGSHQLSSTAGVKPGTKKDANKKSSAGQSATNITSTSHSGSGSAGNESKTGGSGTGAFKSKQQSQQHANPNSSKFNSVSNGKQQNKDTNSQNITNSATNNRKGGENRFQNRPPRQDRQQQQQKPQNATSFGGTTQENSWSTSNWVAPKEQKDIDEKKNKRNREDRPPFYQNTDFNREKGEEGKGKIGRQAVRGGFRGRGGRGGRNFDNRGKREFDRQSGSDKTGIKPNEKREGSGSFNWGTFNDDIEGQTNPTQDENQEKSGDENLFETDGKENESGNEEMEKGKELDENAEEDAVKEMTYDEWKKMEEEKRAKPIFNLRKPGEGEDVAQWKNTYVLKKKEDEDEEVEEVEYIEEEEVKHGRQKRILDIEINFKDENRDSRRGRGRGPRGGANRGTTSTPGERRGGDRPERGDRGERGQGNRRGQQMRGRDSKDQPALRVDVNNIIDFPSLAAA